MSQLTICLIIFAITVVGYCSGLYSLASIAVASMLALTVTGCLDASTALACFSNANVIMIAGMCIVAAGFNRTQFCGNIANQIAGVAKGSVTKMLLGYVLIAVLLSQFIQSPVVVFGIVAPMLIASAESMNVAPSKVMFAAGTAAIITCCTIPLGAGATVASELNGYLESYGYTTYLVSLTDPMKARLPLLIIVVLYAAFIAPKFSPELETAAAAHNAKQATKKEPLKALQEYAGIIIFFADAAALMFASELGLANWQITVIGAILMIFFGVLQPKEATAALPISMLLLIAGSLGISSALSSTGAGAAIGDLIGGVVESVGGNSYIVGFIFFLIPFLMTQVMQNRATMAIFHPIAIATCASLGANPVGLMIIVQSACLSAFMTPMATPAVPYIMDYGGYDQKTMILQSLPLATICCIVSVCWTMTVFPLF